MEQCVAGKRVAAHWKCRLSSTELNEAIWRERIAIRMHTANTAFHGTALSEAACRIANDDAGGRERRG
jgi:hypothetical protein